mmetsp:Transcript_21704/g.33986  ORF Transcript_21704/g.33986 Transcript_21704/m.33986 type:complete len:230 (-) Transcript_21704:211-900(-)|eukprot:CAMPEP_0184312468 /NCGR_PEP_ID=MMETSP1049-20130417/50590_1 /TAXON_ID=77928 /ORGANISM="Proteomonas sulcata, Strain CCMP704" /LENGTH=229 /DNA_ID=CAMNT_0026628677 /DNA_START=94 /DNA_END=786 /DNA_ORIENTATION=+
MATADGPGGNSVLYVKEGPTKGTLGNCPFCFKASFALFARGIDIKVLYVDLNNKPSWFVEELNPKGTAPVFVTPDGTIITESEEIVEWCDQQKPELPPYSGRPGSAELKELCTAIFKSWRPWIVNTSPEDDDSKKKTLMETLAALDNHLETCEGPFLLGKDLCSEDLRLAPVFWVLSEGGPYFKEYDVISEFPRLKAAVVAILSTEGFKAACYTKETLIQCYTALRDPK